MEGLKNAGMNGKSSNAPQSSFVGSFNPSLEGAGIADGTIKKG